MSITNHPCDRYSCPENHGGQCFGGVCRLNPWPDYQPLPEWYYDDDDKDGIEVCE